ncbi:MAG: hypothetical protein QM765_37575 [Myxococcales bacterium]
MRGTSVVVTYQGTKVLKATVVTDYEIAEKEPLDDQWSRGHVRQPEWPIWSPAR